MATEQDQEEQYEDAPQDGAPADAEDSLRPGDDDSRTAGLSDGCEPQSELELRAAKLAGRRTLDTPPAGASDWSEVPSLSREIEILRGRYAEAQDACGEAESEAAHLAKELEEARAAAARSLAEAERLQSEAQSVGLDAEAALALQEKAREASELAGSLAREVERRETELRGAQSRIVRLENDLSMERMTPGEREFEITGLRSALDEAREDALRCQRETSDIKTDLALSRAEAQSRGEEIEELTAKLDACRADLVLREYEVATLQEQTRNLVNEQRRLDADATELRSELDTAQERLAARDREISAQAEHLSITREGHARRDSQIEALQANLQSSSEESLVLEAEIATLRAERRQDRSLLEERDRRIQSLSEVVTAIERAMVGHGGNLAAGWSRIPAADLTTAGPSLDTAGAEALDTTQALAAPTVATEPEDRDDDAAADASPQDRTVELDTEGDAWQATDTPTSIEAEAAADQSEVTLGFESEATAESGPVDAAHASSEAEAQSASEAEAQSALEDDGSSAAEVEAASGADPEEAAVELDANQPIFAQPPPVPTPIYRFWRDMKVAKLLDFLEVPGFDDLAAHRISLLCEELEGETVHIWSICGGDHEVELRIAGKLGEQGHQNFHFHCLESEPDNVEKRRKLAEALELADQLESVDASYSDWPSDAPCNFVLADNAISHAADPAALLARIEEACAAGATLILSDRLPAASDLSSDSIAAVERVWSVMPDGYKMDHVTNSEHDSASEALAETDDPQPPDLVGLLRERLHPEVRACFGNLMDLFTGPRRGLNFEAGDNESQRFIESFDDVDEARIREESLSPRHIVAVLGHAPVEGPMLVGVEPV